MEYDLRPVFSEQQLQERVCAMAREIDEFYGDEPLVVVCVLKGAFLFFADLTRALRKKNVQLDFVRIASYGMEKQSSRKVIISKDVELSLEGKHVLVVEDIIDTGHSMRFLLNHLAELGAKTTRVAVLVNKLERREVVVTSDFVGFHLPDGFIVGYGLDYAEQYRNLPAIYEVLNP